jgi:hypothetical protein
VTAQPNPPPDGYTVKTVAHVLGWRLIDSAVTPITVETHLVLDGTRTVAACHQRIEADRIAQLLDVHGLVDVDAEAIP